MLEVYSDEVFLLTESDQEIHWCFHCQRQIFVHVCNAPFEPLENGTGNAKARSSDICKCMFNSSQCCPVLRWTWRRVQREEQQVKHRFEAWSERQRLYKVIVQRVKFGYLIHFDTMYIDVPIIEIIWNVNNDDILCYINGVEKVVTSEDMLCIFVMHVFICMLGTWYSIYSVDVMCSIIWCWNRRRNIGFLEECHQPSGRLRYTLATV